jgi:hypothetical protein
VLSTPHNNTNINTPTAGMLRTLDPYTEFENVEQALELQESVSGQYGGVGLVISGDRLPPADKRTGKGTGKGGIVPPPTIPSRGIQVSTAAAAAAVTVFVRRYTAAVVELLCGSSSSSKRDSGGSVVVVCIVQQ